jgi:hypothetical protein
MEEVITSICERHPLVLSPAHSAPATEDPNDVSNIQARRS